MKRTAVANTSIGPIEVAVQAKELEEYISPNGTAKSINYFMTVPLSRNYVSVELAKTDRNIHHLESTRLVGSQIEPVIKEKEITHLKLSILPRELNHESPAESLNLIKKRLESMPPLPEIPSKTGGVSPS